MMNSTEKLQQIFKKPIKKTKKNKDIIYSNEMVKDLKAIIKAKSFKETYDIQERLLNEVNMLSLSFESYSDAIYRNSLLKTSLKTYSIEMYNWFINNSYSTESLKDIINRIKEWFSKAAEKISMFFTSMIDFIPNFIKKMFLKFYARGYKTYTEHKTNFNGKAKVTSKYRLSTNTFELIKKSTVDYVHDLDRLKTIYKDVQDLLENFTVETALEVQNKNEKALYSEYTDNPSSQQLALNEDSMISTSVEGNLEEFGVTQNTSKTLTSVEEILGKNIKGNVEILNPSFVKNLMMYVSSIKKILILHKQIAKDFNTLLDRVFANTTAPEKHEDFKEMKIEFHTYIQKVSVKMVEVLAHNAKNINKRIKAIIKICAIVYNCIKVGAESEELTVNGRVVNFMRDKVAFNDIKNVVSKQSNIINKFEEGYQLVYTEEISHARYRTHAYYMQNGGLSHGMLEDPNKVIAKRTFDAFVAQANKRINEYLGVTDVDENNETEATV